LLLDGNVKKKDGNSTAVNNRDVLGKAAAKIKG